MNSPAKSKINWTSLIIAIIGLFVAMDVFPPEIEKPLTEIALLVGPALVMVFRTWFTEKNE